MREQPLFVPFGGEHLAAMVTLPEGPPRALALFLQGAGAPRPHRYRLWTRACRGLAVAGIASVRMDYGGIGDSTGPYSFEMEEPPVEEALTVAGLVLDRLGLEAFGVVGNCIGARTALAAAVRSKACRSVACILPAALGPILRGQGASAAERKVRAVTSRVPGVGRIAHRVPPGLGLGSSLRFIPELARAIQFTRVMLLHGGTEESRRRLAAAARALPGNASGARAAPLEVWHMPAEGTSGFRPLDAQRLVIESIVEWMDRTLPGAASDARSTHGSAGAA